VECTQLLCVFQTAVGTDALHCTWLQEEGQGSCSHSAWAHLQDTVPFLRYKELGLLYEYKVPLRKSTFAAGLCNITK
jgi:hypothetical protein